MAERREQGRKTTAKGEESRRAGSKMPVGSRKKPPKHSLQRRIPNSNPDSNQVSGEETMSNSSSMAGYTRSRVSHRRGGASPAGVLLAGGALLLLVYSAWRFVYLPSRFSAEASREPRFYTFDVVREYPHDPNAFTQGLLHGGNDTLYESTGLYHRSSVREVLLQTGEVVRQHKMDGSMFGEGLTLLGDRLIQVTWLKTTGFIYDRHNFSKREIFRHQMRDGWGLATDGNIVFGSDGTSTLYHLDPLTFNVRKKVVVRYNGQEVPFLNELEYINGEVWANIWQADCIAKISHDDGLVVGWILLHELRQTLLRSGYTGIEVLNGIAWDEKNKRLFVTGKLWPKLYEIKLRPVKGPLDERMEHLCAIRF